MPRPGWRNLLYRWTGGLFNPGPAATSWRTGRVHRIRRPLQQTHRVAVTSIKGGVGKTTVATCSGWCWPRTGATG